MRNSPRYQHYLEATEEKHEQLRLFDLQNEVYIRHFWNTKQELYSFGSFVGRYMNNET